MTKEEALIRGIIGPTRCEIRVFARAVSVTSHLLFCEGVAQDDSKRFIIGRIVRLQLL